MLEDESDFFGSLAVNDLEKIKGKKKLNVKQTLFLLIGNEVANLALPIGLTINAKELYTLSKKHDLAHLVFDAAIKNGLIDKNSDVFNKLNNQQLYAIYRYNQHKNDLGLIRDAFQKSHIRFVPLKGSIIRDYYPEPWMRTSCDIDILVHEEDLEKAKKALLQIGFTTDGARNYHDISFFKNQTHLELHFNICEMNKQLDQLLKDVWNYVEQYDGYEYRETDSFFVFHHIAHMAYHFLAGGCGIRPFLDLWILRKRETFDEKNLLELLNKCNLVSFYNEACLLSEIWFGDKKHNATTLKIEQFIFEGGVYGSSEKGAVIGIAQHGGSKFRYKWSIAFPSYFDMCNIYPKLKKYKILLPLYYIKRFFTKVFGKSKNRTKKRAEIINESSYNEAKEFSKLIKKLGLKK